MKAALTGATGFVGGHLARALAGEGQPGGSRGTGGRRALRDHAGRQQRERDEVSPIGGQSFQGARRDQRLSEIDVGGWDGRTYAEIVAEQGEIVDPAAGLFSVRPPRGEWYDEIAARLTAWLDEHGGEEGDKIVIMHGMSSAVLRGVLTARPVDPRWGAPIAARLPQGSMVMIEGGVEQVVHLAPAKTPA